LPLPFIRFIGISEILGAIGLILPWLLKIYLILTPLSAILFAFIMIPAANIHYKRKEYKNVFTNIILFICCAFIAFGREKCK
jgi:4-hydroxybenzoate polyprenyltransferase